MICLPTDPALLMCANNPGVQNCFSLSEGMLSSYLSTPLTVLFRQLVTNSLSSSPCISLWELTVDFLPLFIQSVCFLRYWSLTVPPIYLFCINQDRVTLCLHHISIKMDNVHPKHCKWYRSSYNKTYFILAVELLVRNMCRQIRVQESAEGQPITPAAAEVGNINIL